jgi:hypothetical protein
MQFTGEFDPPALGVTSVPIPVAGPGTITATEEGLVAAGHRPRSTALVNALWLLSVLAALLLGRVVFRDGKILQNSFGYFVGFAGATLIGSRRKVGKKAVRLAYSWHQVGKMSVAPDGRSVVLAIASKGLLHFRPDIDAAAMLAHLEAGPAIDDADLTHAALLTEQECQHEHAEAPRYRS